MFLCILLLNFLQLVRKLGVVFLLQLLSGHRNPGLQVRLRNVDPELALLLHLQEAVLVFLPDNLLQLQVVLGLALLQPQLQALDLSF